MSTIVVDCRMIRASGIGTYLRAVLGRLISYNSYDFVLLGKTAELTAWLSENRLKASIVSCEAPIYGIREQWQLWRAIPRNCDLYWAPHYVIPILYKGRLLVTIHDVNHLAMANMLPSLAARIYARLMFPLAAKKAAQIITDSNFSRSQIISYIKVEERKIIVIHCGCTNLSKADGATKIDGPFILYVGNAKPHKNLSRVLTAHSSIFPKIKWPLVVVGKNEGFITGDAELQHKIKAIPKGQAYFVGEVSDADLAVYYQAAGFLVMASLYEGFGLPALEAMGAGVPVLASRVASLPEVCGDAALYCDPYSVDDIGEKMALLASAPGLRKKLVEKGKQQAPKFSWRESARSHLKIIDSLLKG